MGIIRDRKDKLAIRPTDKNMEITQRRPYDIWAEMDQLFDRMRAGFDELFWGPNRMITPLTESRMPMMDVADLGDRYEMVCELPGIPKDKIDIQVTPNSVEISAKQELNEEEKHKNWIRRERSSTSFYRYMDFPEELKTDEVEAEMKDGVLTIKLPKVEPKPEYKSTKVKIK
ncbi:MAG: Hsp20/alpha crystallin family protein [Candidatus Thermoplasmatota archaeon]